VDDVVAYISEALPTQYHQETYKKAIEDQGVDGEVLLFLTEQDMKDDLQVIEREGREKIID
jgi:hypothetical protein